MLSLPLLSFVGSAFFLVTVIAIHFIRTDLQIFKNALSNYALGKHGLLLTLGFYAIGTSQVILAAALINGDEVGIGQLALTLAGSGTIILAIFKVENPRRTIQGTLHNLGAAAQFLFFPISLFFLSSTFLGDWQLVTKLFAFATSLLSLGILYVSIRKIPHAVSNFGLIQKTNIILMSSWVILTSSILI